MQDLSTRVIPAAVTRRLLLNLCGWRLVDGRYQCGDLSISEEQLDTMPERCWQIFIADLVVSAN